MKTANVKFTKFVKSTKCEVINVYSFGRNMICAKESPVRDHSKLIPVDILKLGEGGKLGINVCYWIRLANREHISGCTECVERVSEEWRATFHFPRNKETFKFVKSTEGEAFDVNNFGKTIEWYVEMTSKLSTYYTRGS